jgi:hypothetical protein
MRDRILLTLAFAMTVAPAFAVPTPVPEPATMTGVWRRRRWCISCAKVHEQEVRHADA